MLLTMSKMRSLAELVLHPGNVIVIGPHLSGKTTVLRDIISCYDQDRIIRDLFLFEYEHGGRMFLDMVPIEHTFQDSLETCIGSFMMRCRESDQPVLIMDDCVYGIAFHYRYTMELIQHRVRKIIVSVCYPFRIDVSFKWVVVLPCEFRSYRDQLYSQYLGDCIEKGGFIELMDYIGRLHIAAVINTKTGEIACYDTKQYWRYRSKRIAFANS